jgi:hypothetical protein
MTDNSADKITTSDAPLKDGSTSFGSFYPKNYVLSVFKTLNDATKAGDALRAGGFAEDHVIVASGEDIAAYEFAAKSQQGVFAKIGEKLSQLYTDEATDSKALVAFARDGAAFTLAYAPDDAITERAANILRPLHPPIMRKYDALKITELA